MNKIEDRQKLEHSGANLANSEKISVSVVFDNSQKMLPLNKPHVSFRRQWTSDNKDEYYLNNQRMLSKEVEDLFDVFGLSRTNPYNIVHQGTIEKISLLSAPAVFGLLEEVSGINVYESRKSQG